MSGSLPYALGLVFSAIGAAFAGVPWVAMAALLAAMPYVVIGVVLRVDARRSDQGVS